MKGIVLCATAHKDSDLILSILANNGALLRLIARGAKKSKKRFGGGILEPSHYISFSLQNSRGELGSLAEASLLKDFSGIRKDYDNLSMAYECLKLCLKCAKEELENPEIFHLLGNTLKLLEGRGDLRLLSIHFKIRLLAIMGMLPELEGIQPFIGTNISESFHLKISKSQLDRISKEVDFSLKSFLQ